MTKPSPRYRNPRPISRAPVPFTWGAFIGGVVLACSTGMFLNLISGIIASTTHEPMFALLIGAMPGAFWFWYGLTKRALHPGFGTGLLVGGCIVALLGGACGVATLGDKFLG